MTQELIANMLGVRRAGVTSAAGKLHSEGVIEYSRGRIKVVDRPKLEKLSCECYEVVRREFARLLPEVKALWRAHRHAVPASGAWHLCVPAYRPFFAIRTISGLRAPRGAMRCRQRLPQALENTTKYSPFTPLRPALLSTSMRSSRARAPRKLDPYEYERLARQIASIDAVTLSVARRQIDRFLRDCPLSSAALNTAPKAGADVCNCAAAATTPAALAATASGINL